MVLSRQSRFLSCCFSLFNSVCTCSVLVFAFFYTLFINMAAICNLCNGYFVRAERSIFVVNMGRNRGSDISRQLAILFP